MYMQLATKVVWGSHPQKWDPIRQWPIVTAVVMFSDVLFRRNLAFGFLWSHCMWFHFTIRYCPFVWRLVLTDSSRGKKYGRDKCRVDCGYDCTFLASSSVSQFSGMYLGYQPWTFHVQSRICSKSLSILLPSLTWYDWIGET